MNLIKADHDRKIEIPGVPGLVRRPVDIDQSRTGFTALRTLRIYRFDTESVINGHAEEDEVFIVVIAGSVELTMSGDNWLESQRKFTLAAAGDSPDAACAAYLPPHAAYRLIPQSEADIAYARATPSSSRPPKVFTPRSRVNAAGVTVWLDETTYAERLRLRLVQIDAQQNEVALSPIDESEAKCEALVHVRNLPVERSATMTRTDSAPILLESWDTVAVAPADHPALRIAMGSSALVFLVMAE